MTEQFSRLALLFGQSAVQKLSKMHVAVFGIGGVGGYVVEALARSGIGMIDLIDSDKVVLSNLNRQIIATHQTLGLLKTEAAQERILSINPNCKVQTHNVFFSPQNADLFDFKKYDYVADAIDSLGSKICLIEKAKAAGTPIISAMGAANKIYPERFEVADIYQTSVCPVAKILRKELKKRGINNLKVVYSKEQPLVPNKTDEEGKVLGSTAFTPPVVGLIIAAEIIKDLLNQHPGENNVF